MADLPETVGRYTVAGRLGSGGMGEVLLAYTPGGEPVAVKLIRADRLNEQTRARFEQEAIKARTVMHTSRVARFLDADPFAERPWLAMQYVKGPTLSAFVDAAGVLPTLFVASMGALLTEGLMAVHAAELLHRDLKPANVILGDDGPAIIDFGLAAFVDAASSLSHSGMVIGTPVALPPEQAAGQTRVTPAADVYGLGVVLLYAAAGHYPYAGASPDVVIARVASGQIAPDLSGLPPELAPLVSSMLAQEAVDRPALEDVAAACSALVVGHSLNMVQARRAFLAHVARNVVPDSSPDAYSVSSSLEARIDAQAAALAEQQAPGVEVLSSPLNGPPGQFERLLRELASPSRPADSDVRREGEKAEEAGRRAEAVGHRKAKRVPASRKIAQELREAYARSAAL